MLLHVIGHVCYLLGKARHCIARLKLYERHAWKSEQCHKLIHVSNTYERSSQWALSNPSYKLCRLALDF